MENQKTINIGGNAQISVNIGVNTQRKVILTEFFVICPKCRSKGIIYAKKAGKFKLGICKGCHSKTWLRLLGKVKRFGQNDAKIRLGYFQAPFEAFWLNCVGNQ